MQDWNSRQILLHVLALLGFVFLVLIVFGFLFPGSCYIAPVNV